MFSGYREEIGTDPERYSGTCTISLKCYETYGQMDALCFDKEKDLGEHAAVILTRTGIMPADRTPPVSYTNVSAGKRI